MRDQSAGEPLVQSLFERIQLQFRSVFAEQLDLAAATHTAALGEGPTTARLTVDGPPSTVRIALRPSDQQSSVERFS